MEALFHQKRFADANRVASAQIASAAAGYDADQGNKTTVRVASDNQASSDQASTLRAQLTRANAAGGQTDKELAESLALAARSQEA